MTGLSAASIAVRAAAARRACEATAHARCLDRCGWTAHGPVGKVEIEARRHSGDLKGGPVPAHPTVVESP